MSKQTVVITDTSVLVNFLALDGVALLASTPNCLFVVTDHVRGEVTEHYPDQLERLDAALAANQITEISVNDPVEVALFAETTKTGLGIGECSAIAVAVNRGHSLAIDDRTARKRVAKLYPDVPILTTESLVVALIRAGNLTVEQADSMKAEWEQHHRFRLPFASFADKV